VLEKWPVSKRVNGSRTSDEDSTLIEPIAIAASSRAVDAELDLL
jgi:hypothetical protein